MEKKVQMIQGQSYSRARRRLTNLPATMVAWLGGIALGASPCATQGLLNHSDAAGKAQMSQSLAQVKMDKVSPC